MTDNLKSDGLKNHTERFGKKFYIRNPENNSA